MNIFIHGWSFDKTIWKDFYNLENSLFFNLPFHGDFKDFEDKNIIENYIEYIKEKIKKSSTLIGWSLGATISVLFYLKYPEKVKKLILIGFSPKFKDEKLGHNPKNVRAFMISLKKDFKNTVFNFRKSSSNCYFKSIPLPEEKGSYNLLNEYINLDISSEIEKIDVPTTLIHGKKDKIINPLASIFSNQKIKNSKLIQINSHHAPFLEDKQIILDEIYPDLSI